MTAPREERGEEVRLLVPFFDGQPVSVWATPVESLFVFLALDRQREALPGNYAIAHHSGFSIATEVPTLAQAVACALDLAELLDWTQPAEAIARAWPGQPPPAVTDTIFRYRGVVGSRGCPEGKSLDERLRS